MDCQCPIWITGRAGNRVVPRQSLDTTDARVAEAKRLAFLAEADAEDEFGISIRDARQKFTDQLNQMVGADTVSQYALLLDRLQDYCRSRGAAHMSQLTADLLEDFKTYGLPDVKDSTRKLAVIHLRAFLREAFRRDWIKVALADKVRRYAAAPEQKEPFSEAEVASLLAGASALTYHGRGQYAKHPATFRLLLELMLETGLRVSDAVQFEPKQLRRGASLWTYSFLQKKRRRGSRPRPMEVYISDKLKHAIDNAEWLSPVLPFAFVSKTRLGLHVRALMQRIGRDCGIADCRPHRLRDTFAVRMLLRGVAIGDVSKLLGHTSVRTTEDFYAKWDLARANRLESIAAKALMHPQSNALGNPQMSALTAGSSQL